MKNLYYISAVMLLLGISAASAQTDLPGETDIPGSLTAGGDNTATNFSVAMGNGNVATGWGSIALGWGCQALGVGSIAIGSGAYVGDDGSGYSWASGGNVALNDGFIDGGTYDGFAANAGYFTPEVNPEHSLSGPAALNYGVTGAEGALSANFGIANNYLSAAFGYGTVTASPAQFVIGICNRIVGDNEDFTSDYYSVANWSSTNAIFIIGNGTLGATSNAMQVRRDGMVLIQAAGDFGMQGFTNGPIP